MTSGPTKRNGRVRFSGLCAIVIALQTTNAHAQIVPIGPDRPTEVLQETPYQAFLRLNALTIELPTLSISADAPIMVDLPALTINATEPVYVDLPTLTVVVEPPRIISLPVLTLNSPESREIELPTLTISAAQVREIEMPRPMIVAARDEEEPHQTGESDPDTRPRIRPLLPSGSQSVCAGRFSVSAGRPGAVGQDVQVPMGREETAMATISSANCGRTLYLSIQGDRFEALQSKKGSGEYIASMSGKDGVSRTLTLTCRKDENLDAVMVASDGRLTIRRDMRFEYLGDKDAMLSGCRQ